jgi:hypothetical protein
MKFTEKQQNKIDKMLHELSRRSGLRYSISMKHKSIVVNEDNYRTWFTSYENLKDKLSFANDTLYMMAAYQGEIMQLVEKQNNKSKELNTK